MSGGDQPATDAVARVLDEARRRGFLGPGPVAGHVGHARAMAEFVGRPAGDVLDLGSGGGIPGLILACCWPEVEVVLLDSMQRRCAFLREALGSLGPALRVRVVEGRAESLARDAELRERFAVVVARAFGAPPVTAECGVGFVQPGGSLVVSEPPEATDDRWPAGPLEVLGLAHQRTGRVAGASFVELRRIGALDPRWPRRDGVPAKRPLW